MSESTPPPNPTPKTEPLIRVWELTKPIVSEGPKQEPKSDSLTQVLSDLGVQPTSLVDLAAGKTDKTVTKTE